MDQMWVEVIRQSPSVGFMVFIVVYFVRSLKDIANIFREGDKKNAEMLKTVVDKNTTSLDRNTEMLGRYSYAIEKGATNRMGHS